MDEVEFDEKLDDMESDEARASEMQNALEHEINVRIDEDPVHYGSLRERLEELIEEYREGRLSEKETIEELRELMDEMRSRDKTARSKGLRDETDLSFYHAVEDVLQSHDVEQSEFVELTTDLVETVEEFVSKVEWREKTHLRNKMRKEVTGQLYRTEIALTNDERKELTNRVIELAREHYQ
jgi:type I restriction enzyme R subunit